MNKLLKELSFSPFFTTSDVAAFLPHLKRGSVYRKITRWLKKGEIIKLKKGFFVAEYYKDRHIGDSAFIAFLANSLRRPSYISGVYVLQSRGVMVEATYPITSVTTKTTRTYVNNWREFIYYSISPKLYTGYNRSFYIDQPVYIATLAKALFDYFYIKYSKTSFSANDILARERLNLDMFNTKDIKEFKGFCELSKNNVLIELSKKLFSKKYQYE